MSGLLDDPPRLKEKHDQANLAERIAGQAFRDMPAAAPLSSTVLARIAAQTEETAPAPGTRGLRWAFLCCAFLLGIATAASAEHLDILPGWLSRPFTAKPKLVSHQHPSPAISRERQRPMVRSADELPSAVAPADSHTSEPGEAQPATDFDRSKPDRSGSRDARPSVPKEERKSRTTTTPPTGVPPALASAESHSASSTEPKPAAASITTTGERDLRLALVGRKEDASAFAKATALARPTASPGKPATVVEAQHAAKYLDLTIRALRVEHSPKTALALLDRHSAELYGDAFAHETLLLRVEAMLSLGQQAQVLRLLDGASLTDVAASRSLLVTRGQLRVAANRCSEGIGDFDRVLAEAGQPSKQALLGRAVCRKRLGDAAGAQADLERYRREFPGDPAPRL